MVIQGDRGLQDRQLMGISFASRGRDPPRNLPGPDTNRCKCCRPVEMLDSFDKADVFGEHHELHDVATNTASEATPGLGHWKDAQVGTAAVGVEGTAPQQAAALSSELDAETGDHVFDGMRLLEDIDVDPSCTIVGARRTDGHAG